MISICVFAVFADKLLEPLLRRKHFDLLFNWIWIYLYLSVFVLVLVFAFSSAVEVKDFPQLNNEGTPLLYSNFWLTANTRVWKFFKSFPKISSFCCNSAGYAASVILKRKIMSEFDLFSVKLTVQVEWQVFCVFYLVFHNNAMCQNLCLWQDFSMQTRLLYVWQGYSPRQYQN